MDYKYCCVIGDNAEYVDFVLVLINDGVQNYTLAEGEQLVDAAPPPFKPYDGAYGFVKPCWDGAAWCEAATAAEIAAWEADNPNPVTLADYKAAKIAESKTQLAAYLEAHPLTYTDGKQYSVTAEKQSLLTSALARHQIATSAGAKTTLKWNATGEECTVWEYADLAALALAIAAYVEPLVGQQQKIEVAINGCTTVDEVKATDIAYGI